MYRKLRCFSTEVARSVRELCYDGSVATLLFGGGGKTYFNVKKYGVVKHY